MPAMTALRTALLLACSAVFAGADAWVKVDGLSPEELGKLVETGPDVEFLSLPPVMQGGELKKLYDLRAGQALRLECPHGTTGSCMFYVMHHHCGPCSAAVNGGLPDLLTRNGFSAQPHRCAPRFRAQHTGAMSHPTALYQREVMPGVSVALRLAVPLLHGAVVMTTLPKLSCAAQDHPRLCGRNPNCKWDSNTQMCSESWCPPEAAFEAASCLKECQLLRGF